MKPSPENVRLAKEIHGRLNQLTVPSTALVRAIRKEFSGRITDSPPESVVQLALHLLNQNSDLLRFFSYELLSRHRPAFEQLTTDDVLHLGKGLNSWSSVDCFGMYLSGPLWAQGRISERMIANLGSQRRLLVATYCAGEHSCSQPARNCRRCSPGVTNLCSVGSRQGRPGGEGALLGFARSRQEASRGGRNLS
jgi:hypothetical protein